MRLLHFLAESSLKKGLRVKTADSSEEYTEDDVKEALETLTSAVKEARKSKDSEHKAAEKDFMSKLRGWLKLADDRFPDALKQEKNSAKDVLQGKGPEKTMAPVTPETPMPVKLAVKTGILPGNEEE